MTRKTLYKFADNTSVGLNYVPSDSTILINDIVGEKLYITLLSTTTPILLTNTTTIQELLDQPTQYEHVISEYAVEASGAVMELDTTTIDMNFVIDEDDMISDSDILIPTQQSVKAYVDSISASPAITTHPTIKPSLLLDFSNTDATLDKVTNERATVATYYDGKTKHMTNYNLAILSEDYSTTWLSYRCAHEANSILAPSGEVTGCKVIEDTATGYRFLYTGKVISIVNKWCTTSMYIKEGTSSLAQLTTSGSSLQPYANFDLFNGTITKVGGPEGTTASITDEGDGWYRCSVSGIQIANGYHITAGILSSDAIRFESYLGDGISYFYAWGAQLTNTEFLTDYVKTEATYTGTFMPTLIEAAINGPRLCVHPSTHENFGIVSEDQSTNLFLNSGPLVEDFNNTGILYDDNRKIAPDSSSNAVRAYVSATDENHRFWGGVTVPGIETETIYSFSMFIKPDGINIFLINLEGSSNGFGYGATFNFITETATAAGGATGITLSAGMIDVGNGWYRCNIVALSSDNITQANVLLDFKDDAGNSTFLGDGVSGGIFWGFQLEKRNVSTSYIETTDTQITRAADYITIEDDSLSDAYNEDEGTLFVHSQIIDEDTEAPIASLDDGSINNQMSIKYSALKTANANIVKDGVSQLDEELTLWNSSPRKFALSYKHNDCAFGELGSAPINDLVAEIPRTNILRLGAIADEVIRNPKIYYKKIAYYPKKLTDIELQAMTKD